VRCSFAGGEPHRGIWPGARVADPEIEDDRRGHNWHDAGPHGEPDAAIFQVPHDAGRRVQAESASSRQQHPADMLYGALWAEQIGLAGARCSAPDIHAADCARRTDNHRATRDAQLARRMTHENAWHVADRAV
jgi:hypothetical protein